MGWLTGWLHRKSVPLSRASGAVTNYQMKLFVGESSGAAGEDVDCGGLCQTDFDDIRFTASDGTTLLDYWIESITGATPNQLATIWIEFDSIGTGATTFYMYFGNAGAAAASNGASTFLFFEDFEWGVNGDNLNISGGGHTWTTVQGFADIATGKFYSGSRSARFNGAATYPHYTTPYTLAENISINVRCYKETAVDNGPNFNVGNNQYGVGFYITSDEVAHDANSTLFVPTKSVIADQWQLYEIFAINLTAHTYNLSVEGAAAVVGDMAAGLAPNVIRVINASTTAGQEVWFDAIYIRQRLATEPAWGAWGDFESINVPACYLHARRDRLNIGGISTQNQLA